MDYTQDRLSIKTAKFAAGYDGVCLFVNDTADADVLWTLSMGGVKSVFMRCAGFDRVDIKATKLLGMSVLESRLTVHMQWQNMLLLSYCLSIEGLLQLLYV